MGEMLFEGYEPAEPAPVEKVSADRRRTLRQAAYVAAGIHPLTKGRLHPLASRNRDADSPKSDPYTCGSCYFRSVDKYHDRSYPKCWLPGPVRAYRKGRDGEWRWETIDLRARIAHTRATMRARRTLRYGWREVRPRSSLSPDAARSIP